MAKRRHLSDTGIARALDPAIGLARRQRFQSRLLGYLLALSCLFSVVAGSIYYSRQVKFVRAEQAIRGNTLINNLAGQSELGAYSNDSAFLWGPVRRAFAEKDVTYAAVYNRQGDVLVQMAKPDVEVDWKLESSLLRQLLQTSAEQPLRRRQANHDDLMAPIVTLEGDSEAHLFGAVDAAHRPAVIGVARLGLSHQPAQEKLDDVLRWGIYLSLIILTLGAGFALLLAHRIAQPILALARGADEVRKGNLGYQFHLERGDELGLLAESFNRMSSKLKRTIDSLADLNRNLERKVARRTVTLRRSRDFVTLLNAPLQLDKLLDTALRSLANHLGASAGAIFLFTEQERLELAAHHGPTKEPPGFMPSSPFPEPVQQAIESHHALVVQPPFSESPWMEQLPQAEHVLLAPVEFRERLEAVLVLALPQAPTNDQVDFVDHAASQLAIAVANARAYLDAERLAQELERRNQALLQQRDQLQEHNRLKSEFVANTSHELRTPLNAIIGFAELMSEGIYGELNEEQQQALDGISENASSLQLLIDQILNLSKVEAGKMNIQLEPVEINQLLQEVVDFTAPLVKDRPYVVTANLLPQPLWVTTDRGKVKQILVNLVGNAIKFTSEGGVAVTVEANPQGDLWVQVEDTGIGIGPEHLNVIFDEFRQVDGSSTRTHGGTGLGLAISKKFATLLGGDVEVTSAPGEGSCFTLLLPKVAPQQQEHAAEAPEGETHVPGK